MCVGGETDNASFESALLSNDLSVDDVYVLLFV